MTMDIDAYRELFVEEAREHLLVIQKGLAAVHAAHPATPPKEHADPDALFRAAHSLKGMAATVGLGGIAALAHALEDALSALQSNKTIDTSALLAAVDAVQDAVEAVAAGAGADAVAHLADLAAKLQERPHPTGAGRGGDTSSAAAEPPLPRSVRVPAESVDRILDRTVALQIEEERLARLVQQAIGREQSFALTQAMSRIRRAAQMIHADTVALRALPVELATAGLPRRARDVAARQNKHVIVEVTGGETRIDRTLLEAIRDPLQHLVTNAVVHGIETPEERRATGKARDGKITIRVTREPSALLVRVSDDGAGIDHERIRQAAIASGLITSEEAAHLDDAAALALLTRPGFSLAGRVDHDAGRGVGLDVVAAAVTRVGGTFHMSSRRGEGTVVLLTLPPTLELVDVIDVEVDEECFAVPAASVERIVRLSADAVHVGQTTVRDDDADGRAVPVLDLAVALGLDRAPRGYANEEGEAAPVVRLARRLKAEHAASKPLRVRPGSDPARTAGLLFRINDTEVCLAADRVAAAREAIVKPLGVPGGPPAPLAGATLRDDGRVAPILEPTRILAAPTTGPARVRHSIH